MRPLYLDDIESKIKDEFDIPCAVVGNDEKICIFVDINKLEEILQYSLKMFSIHPQKMKIKYIEKIPKLESGKTDYTKLLKGM